MAVHSFHPPIQESGLADGCERCKELGEHPFEGLDTQNLCDLEERTLAWMNDEPEVWPRSENEHAAMRLMENHIRRQRVLMLSRESVEAAR